MTRIFVNLPLQTLENMLQNADCNEALVRALIEELSLRNDPGSLRLLLKAKKLIDETKNSTKKNLADKSLITSEKFQINSKTCPECKTPYKDIEIPNDFSFSYCDNPNCNRVYLKAKDTPKSSKTLYYENVDKDGIISIDFGTSSIRASYASHDGNDNQPIPIGARLGVSDDFYLDSKILVVNPSLPVVFLSQWAEVENSKQKPHLYSTSPKNWITTDQFNNINNPISPKHNVSRKNLLSLLVSLAIKGVRLELNLSLAELLNYEIRISHPVWETQDWTDKKNCLESILHEAIYLSDHVEHSLDFDQIENLLSTIPSTMPLYSSIDIIEPVAAAVELFKNKPGYRQICAVIDIGAGTTDMGLFSSTTPDISSYLTTEDTPIKKIFKSIANPVSIQKAGDYIDEILADIYIKKTGNYENESELMSFLGQIRSRKPSLFEDEEIYIDDIRITLPDLVNHTKTKLFTDELNKSFIELIKCAQDEIERQFNLNVNYIRSIDLIFSGGGHQISFIRECIPKVIALRNQSIRIEFQEIKPAAGLSIIDHARLAASLGGSCSSSNWPTVNPVAQNYGPLDFKFNKSPFPNRL